MEDAANRDVAEIEDSTGSAPSPPRACSGTMPNKRFRYNTSLPHEQKGTATVGSDPKQKMLPFLVARQTKCTDTADAMPVQKFVLPDIHTEKNRKYQDVDQSGCHKEPEPEFFTDHNQKNQSHEQIAPPEQDIPNDMSRNNQMLDENCSPEELVRILAVHGYIPTMMQQDGFQEVFACFNPMIRMPSQYDLIGTTRALFQLEKSKLKEKLAALRSRVCLSAYIWHHDPHSAFLCLSVHYIDDEWENHQRIIKFSPVDSSCSAKELSDITLGAIGEWGLDSKVFSIILDDAFVDDSVASDVKASLQKSNKLAASQSLFVVRYASHLLDQVIQMCLDELERIKEKSAKCFKYAKDPNHLRVQHPNCRNASSPKDWERAKNICEILEDCYVHIELMPRLRSPAYLFGTLKEVFHKIDFYSQLYKSDEIFSNVLEKIKQKFKEHWDYCFLHFCMPMVMDPEYSLDCIKPHVRDNSEDDYVQKVRDTFISLFNEYSDQVDGPNCSSGSKASKGTVLDEDTLSKYYHDSQNRTCERPMTELCQYLQEQHSPRRKPKTSILQWWKEHSLTYPTIAQMARDILALPLHTDCNVATRTAGVAMCESASERHVEMLVCTQDWLTPAGTKSVESTNDI